MDSTFDLPDALASAIKRRAALEGRNLEDVVVGLLRAGMAPAASAETEASPIVTKALPLIKVRPVQPPNAKALSQQEWCDWIKDRR